MLLRIFSVAFWAFICLTLPIFFIGALIVTALTAVWDRRRVVLHLYSCFWASFYLYTNPLWTVEVTGREKLPWRGPAVLVSNHASLIDILVLFALYRPYKWVSKVENFKLPFIGWNMTLNQYVPLVRGDPASVEAMMDTCRDFLRRGIPVLIFPEGTRSKTGELQPFKSGAFRLAHEMGCPLIPIGVVGTGEALPKHGLILKKRMDARVTVLDALDPRDFEGFEGLRDEAHDRLERFLTASR